VLENTHLYSRQNRSTNQGNLTVNARVDIRNLLEPVLEIKGRSTGTLATIADFADKSPIAEVFGGQLGRVTLGGNASLDLDLLVPIRDWTAFEFTALIASKDGSLAVAGLNPPLTGVSGNVTVSKDSIASEDLTGIFLGEPVAIELENAPPDQPAYRVVANATGAASATAIVAAFELPLADRLSGTLAYEAQLLFPRGGQEPPVGFSVELQSDLSGLRSDLPAPLDKAADSSWPVQAGVTFEPGGELIRTTGSAESKFDWQISFARTAERWDFDRGVVAFGQGVMEEPDVRGLHIGGRTDEVQLADWLALSRGQSAGRGAGERIRSVDIVVDNFYYLGQHFKEQRVRVDRSARDWLVQLDGNDMTGSIFVPYDFSASSTLVLDMERFVLPGDARAESAEAREPDRIDPRTLPAISFRSKEFGVRELRFGALEAEFEQTAEGLVSKKLNAVDASFSIHGSARWINDMIDPLDSRTYLDVTLTSIDVEQTMQRLGYQPGIVSDDMRIALDLNWSGGPRAEFLASVDGAVDVRLGSGQLDEVEPGAGRVFGLMSIVSLPRRLSLDFRDVFQKGFGFDEIGGTFKLENGLAYTCDLSLEGPAADIAIIGQADLVAGEYEQTAVVSAKVGNTLPVVGALAAGPQVAAAMFLLTQIFKKPLQDLGQVYYSMHGSWDSPVVESTNAEAFTTSGRVAGCLSDSE
jgi:uncharacterized protein (TIGR02099 family)